MSMNHMAMGAMLRILQVITALILIPPGAAQAQAEPEIQFKGPYNVGEVHSVAFSPDGKILAEGNASRTIGFWDVGSGKLIRSFEGHSGKVYSVAFSPDGKTLASASADHTIKLWQAPSGKLIRLLSGHKGSVFSVAFSPDGKTLASAGDDYDGSALRLWEVSTGRPIHSFEESKVWATSVVFSPDGKTLASVSGENSIKLWDVVARKFIRSLPGHRNTIYSLAFSPDGKMLASGSNDHKVKLWDVSAGKLIRNYENGQSVNAVAFSPDGKTLAAGTYYYKVNLWDANDESLIHTFDTKLRSTHSLAFSPDGKTLVSGELGGTMKIWSIAARSLLGELLHFEDGNWIATIPGNYYVSSEGAAQYISWRFEHKDYAEPQFRSRFYQPDKVAAVLSGKEMVSLTSSVKTEAGKPDSPGANSVATKPTRPPIRDTTPPRIIITSPSVTRGIRLQSGAARTIILGQALDDSGVKKVVAQSRRTAPSPQERLLVDSDGKKAGAQGTTARLDPRGNFSVEVPIESGDNLITVTAVDVYDNEASVSFTIRRDPAADPITATAPANGGRYHALLIAVQQYDHQSVKSLEYPVSDAQQIERELTGRYTFEPQNVTLLKNPDRRAIFDALDQLAEKLTPEDNLLIFYAGHGHWDEQRKQGYWLPRDATRDRRSEWISNSDLRDAIRGIKARHILLISDACFAGGIFLAREAFGPASSAIAELDNLPSRTAMTSGALTTVPDRSVFVVYLLKRLGENTEARLPALELFNKLRLPVINNSPTQRDGSRPTPRYGTIFEVGDEGGDFIFMRRR